MLVERAELVIRERKEAEFAAMMAEQGLALLAATQGVLALSFGQGHEDPGKFLLLVTWASMEAHDDFRDAPQYPEFRSLLSPFTVGGSMEHFEMEPFVQAH